MKNKSLIMIMLIILILWIGTLSCKARITTNDPTVKSGETFTISVNSQEVVDGYKVGISSNSGLTFISASGGVTNGNVVANTNNSGTQNLATYTFKAPEVSVDTTYTVAFSAEGVIIHGTDNRTSSTATATVKVKANENNNNGGTSNGGGTDNNGGSSNNGVTSNNGGTTNNGGSATNNDDKPKEPTFTQTNETVYVKEKENQINVRSSYTTSSNIVGKLKKGESITRTGVGSNGWSKVNYNGATAYISSRLLTTTKPEEEKSTIKALKSLTVEPGTLSPEFNPETTKYEITVGEDVTKLNIKAVVEDEKSKVNISGNDDLELGENIVKIVVTAEDGTARTYTITVTKEEKEQLKLDTLSVKGINLNPSFSSDIYEYTADVDNDITKLELEAVSNIENATIEILGNEDLQEGENAVTIMLKSEDGKQNVTYQIIVKRAAKTIVNSNVSEESNSNMQYVIVGSILGGILLIIIIALIIKKVRSNREDDGVDLNFMDELKGDNEDSLYGSNVTNEKENSEKYIEDDEYIEMGNRYNKSANKLYNVEDEVDFSDIDKDLKRRKKGKHF